MVDIHIVIPKKITLVILFRQRFCIDDINMRLISHGIRSKARHLKQKRKSDGGKRVIQVSINLDGMDLGASIPSVQDHLASAWWNRWCGQSGRRYRENRNSTVSSSGLSGH